jgi:hypothetical protein
MAASVAGWTVAMPSPRCAQRGTAAAREKVTGAPIRLFHGIATDGQVLNAKTGAVYTLADPCVEHGPHIGFNQAAYQATIKSGARIVDGDVQTEQLKLDLTIPLTLLGCD